MYYKVKGYLRDLHYYLFEMGGWKWVLLIACLLNVARCSVKIQRMTLPPSCEVKEIALSEGPVIITQECKATKEGEDFLCQLLQLDLEENKAESRLIQSLNHAKNAMEAEKQLMEVLFPREESMFWTPSLNVTTVEEVERPKESTEE